jgi:hypothetical protein
MSHEPPHTENPTQVSDELDFSSTPQSFSQPGFKEADVAKTRQIYHVPKKFGMSGMLAITTLMALVFGLLHNFPGGLSFSIDQRTDQTHPAVYIFLGVLVLSTCLAQMLYGDVPRAISCIVGALLFPLSIFGTAMYYRGFMVALNWVCAIPFLAMAGALLGYLAGGCTAGCFLIMDQFDQWYMQRVLKQPVHSAQEKQSAELATSPNNAPPAP